MTRPLTGESKSSYPLSSKPLELGERLVDIEGYKAEASKLQRMVKDLEDKLAKQNLDDTETGHGAERPRRFRSANWFDRSEHLGMRALYVERYLNYGLTKEELLSGKPIIGIAQSGSDLTPCNRHHLELAKRVREGIRSSGGIVLEFPTHPIQESTRRPTAALDRNLPYLALIEVLHSYPFDGVVLLTGCDKTTPACLMAAATVNIPAICLNVGPMLNGWAQGERVGSGSVIWKARELHAAGTIDEDQVVDMVADGTPSPGHCNTMGTASTMNALAEALGMMLPGTSAIPAVYRERSQAAYKTGLKIVEMVHEDVKPCDIMTREAFENAIVVNMAIGGSTNAPIHLNAMARHAGVPLDLNDWDNIGFSVPLLLNMQPAGEMLGEDYHRAGGLPALIAELLEADKLPNPDAMTVNGKTIGENATGKQTWDRQTIRKFAEPLMENAGFMHLTGNLFDSAIMKTSVITPGFHETFLSDPNDPNAFECPVVVFDGPEDYKTRLESAPINDRTVLVMRGVEVVNMHAPGRLLKQGIRDLPCIGDGRQSGTSGSPSILNATPEAANGGNLALLRDGDKVRVDLDMRRVDILIGAEELAERRKELDERGGYHGPPSMTPWQDIYRREVGGLSEGAVFERAVEYQRLAQKHDAPRDNH
ncbi:Uu.00g083690.m01.CDS01 [Anthostomella pinea]|uniref:Uu.00g083690.m01.CDS01 n=1 Tax=Anthostomella pinea TaxID=933095 RepID=A0AAI8VLP6_9PEZI|nr:Uu.00g083690.m01.CDS01 [Anthostomella pinea]